jgi:hypothetical protein
LLKENFTWELRQPGSFSFGHRLKDPLPVAALWIGSDGDDTGSSFELRLQSLELEVSPP